MTYFMLRVSHARAQGALEPYFLVLRGLLGPLPYEDFMHILCFVGRFYGDFMLRVSHARAQGALEPYVVVLRGLLGLSLALGRFYAYFMLRRPVLW